MKTALLTISIFLQSFFFKEANQVFFLNLFQVPSSEPLGKMRSAQVAMLLLALLLSAFTLMRQLYRSFQNRHRGDPFLMTDLMPVQRDNR